jgi:diacylglycerol kinase family enzyme
LSLKLAEEGAKELRAYGWDVSLAPAIDGAALVIATRKALDSGADIVVACGGDGTVSAVASVVAGSQSVFGIFPTGTLNHFARDLRIPLGIKDAVHVLLAGHRSAVDVGEVNGLRFVNNSSLGLYPNIVKFREGRRKTGWSRILAFAAACLVSLRRYRFLRLRLEVDGTRSTRISPFLFVGNNRYELEGLRPGRRDRLSEGKLFAYLAERTGRIGLLRIALSALFHTLRLNHDLVVLPAQRLTVETERRKIRVALDGEIYQLHPPLRYSIHPGLLQVLTPEQKPLKK